MTDVVDKITFHVRHFFLLAPVINRVDKHYQGCQNGQQRQSKNPIHFLQQQIPPSGCIDIQGVVNQTFISNHRTGIHNVIVRTQVLQTTQQHHPFLLLFLLKNHQFARCPQQYAHMPQHYLVFKVRLYVIAVFVAPKEAVQIVVKTQVGYQSGVKSLFEAVQFLFGPDDCQCDCQVVGDAVYECMGIVVKHTSIDALLVGFKDGIAVFDYKLLVFQLISIRYQKILYPHQGNECQSRKNNRYADIGVVHYQQK